MDDNYSIYTKHHRLHVHHMRPDYLTLGELFLPFGFGVRSIFVPAVNFSLNFLNMKLLRILDLPRNELTHGNGIEYLVHLRYLAINCMLALLLGNLVKLEFLIVNERFNGRHSIPSVIQKMMKLRYLRIPLANFDEDWNSSKTNNLEFLSSVHIDKAEDEKMLKCSPHLRKLKCKCRPFWDEKGAYRYPDLCFLTQLEALNLSTEPRGGRAEINFPSNIRKLTLSGLWLPWEKISIIGGLPNLQVLKLRDKAFVGNRWDTRDGEFRQLRNLKLNCLSVTQWKVASSQHFPKLQRLFLDDCYNLQEIPCEIGEIITLQLIAVEFCPKSLVESAIKIQQEQHEMGNEEFRVIIRDI